MKRLAAAIRAGTLIGFSFACGTTAQSQNPGLGAAWSTDPSPINWESTYTEAPPTLDGVVDPIWQKAKSLTVMVREALGGDHPKPVELRALHTRDALYILARWPDRTKSDMRDPYVWDRAAGRYNRPSKPDDQFAIEFPMKGDFAVSMLTVTREYTADVWHWKAGRGNPIGWADDKFHVISQHPVPEGKQHRLHSNRSVYIARVMDAGSPAYRLRPEPASYQGDSVDSFEQQEPAGSVADVRAKGKHDGTTWTLEMSRRFNTGHPEDDAVIDPGQGTICAIAILDDELYEEHSVSSVIILRFVQASSR